ncbi:MAG TPA: hypothetical protein VLG46_13720, partial [Anaerolineae bacterium]|nr:hypothetical protein [Anaerolineae bacterium]
MNARVLIRWLATIVIAVSALIPLGLMLNPVAHARAATVRDWPGVLPPCNASLQQCLDSTLVSSGDIIHIRPGVYTQSVTLYKAVSLIGDGPSVTTLNAPTRQRVLTVTGNLTFSTVISGITFAGGDLIGSICPEECGGGILLSGPARPALQNIVLRENTAWQGGGLWVDGGPEVVVVNSRIFSNSATEMGGGIYAATDVRLINTLIDHNQSGITGGGLTVVGSLNVTNGSILGNTSQSDGGGAYVSAGATLNYGRWDGNTAAGSGGGLFAASLNMTGTSFLNNVGGLYGGGAYLNGVAVMRDGQFVRNHATGGGGAGGLYVGELHAVGTQFI